MGKADFTSSKSLISYCYNKIWLGNLRTWVKCRLPGRRILSRPHPLPRPLPLLFLLLLPGCHVSYYTKLRHIQCSTHFLSPDTVTLEESCGIKPKAYLIRTPPHTHLEGENWDIIFPFSLVREQRPFWAPWSCTIIPPWKSVLGAQCPKTYILGYRMRLQPWKALFFLGETAQTRIVCHSLVRKKWDVLVFPGHSQDMLSSLAFYSHTGQMSMGSPQA